MARLRHYSTLLCMIILSLLSAMSDAGAQEYRYEMGGYAGIASYMGDANRRIPFVPVGATGGAEFRYNHNFRLAFSGQLGYSLLPFDYKFSQNSAPLSEPQQSKKGVSHLLSMQGWAEYNFAHYSDKYRYLNTRSLVPYIGAGLSAGATVGGEKVAFLPGIGLKTGVKYKIRNRLNLVASIQGIYYLSDHLDTPNQSTGWLANPYGLPKDWLKGGDAALALTISLTYEFGKRSEPCRGSDQLQRLSISPKR